RPTAVRPARPRLLVETSPALRAALDHPDDEDDGQRHAQRPEQDAGSDLAGLILQTAIHVTSPGKGGQGGKGFAARRREGEQAAGQRRPPDGRSPAARGRLSLSTPRVPRGMLLIRAGTKGLAMDDPFDQTIELVRRAQGGESEALESLFERYYERVRRMVRL